MNIFFTTKSTIRLFIEGCANENLYKALDNSGIITSQGVFHLHLHHSLGKNLFSFQISDNAVSNDVFSVRSHASVLGSLIISLKGLGIVLANGFCSYRLPLRLVFS